MTLTGWLCFLGPIVVGAAIFGLIGLLSREKRN